MARIKDASVEAVKAAADMVEVVRTPDAAPQGRARATSGRCPFHDERTPSFSRQRRRQALLLLRLRRGRRRDHVRRETENLDFVEAIEWLGRALPRPARVRGDLAASRSAKRAAPRAAAARCSSRRRRVLRARTSGTRRRARPCAQYLDEPRARRGGLPRVPARARARRRRRSPEGAARRASRTQELLAAGSSTGAATTTSRAGSLFPLADARGRVVGFQAREAPRGRPAAGEVRQLARGRALPQGRPPLRPRPRAHRDREAGAGGRRRGQHRRARAAPGRARAGGRVDGDGAHRAAAEGARAG